MHKIRASHHHAPTGLGPFLLGSFRSRPSWLDSGPTPDPKPDPNPEPLPRPPNPEPDPPPGPTPPKPIPK